MKSSAGLTLLVGWLGLWGCSQETPYQRSGRLDVPERLAIAHGLGRIGRAAKTNSIEALEANYERGFRWFEVDLDTTADGALVCIHPAPGHLKQIGVLGSLREISTSEFLERRFMRRLHTQTFRQLLERMLDLPDMIVVTDSKELGRETLERIAADVDAVDPALRSRIVLQMYRREDLPTILEVEDRGGTFGGVVFTLYRTRVSQPELLAFVEESGLEWITTPEARFDSALAAELHERGARVFVHTLNDPEAIERYFADGADGIYTDDWAPEPPPSGPGR